MVSVGTYWAWESTATLRLLGDAITLRPQGGEERGNIVSPRAQLVRNACIVCVCFCCSSRFDVVADLQHFVCLLHGEFDLFRY